MNSPLAVQEASAAATTASALASNNHSSPEQIKFRYRTHPAILANIPLLPDDEGPTSAANARARVRAGGQVWQCAQTAPTETANIEPAHKEHTENSPRIKRIVIKTEQPASQWRLGHFRGATCQQQQQHCATGDNDGDNDDDQFYGSHHASGDVCCNLDGFRSAHNKPFGLQLIGGSSSHLASPLNRHRLFAGGVFVAHVEPDSLAESSGLQVGDQLLAINGSPLVNAPLAALPVLAAATTRASSGHQQQAISAPLIVDSSEAMEVLRRTRGQIRLLILSRRRPSLGSNLEAGDSVASAHCLAPTTMDQNEQSCQEAANDLQARSTKMPAKDKVGASDSLACVGANRKQRQHQQQIAAGNSRANCWPLIAKLDAILDEADVDRQRRLWANWQEARNGEQVAQEKLDALIGAHLSEHDKLNLSYYLNEFETNACDLSELLTNLMQNSLIKLPNPMIKYKLLSYIKQLYVEPALAAGSTTTAAAATIASRFKRPIELGDALPTSRSQGLANLEVAAEQQQLDLRLFEATIQRYLMESNVLMCRPTRAAPGEWLHGHHYRLANSSDKWTDCDHYDNYGCDDDYNEDGVAGDDHAIDKLNHRIRARSSSAAATAEAMPSDAESRRRQRRRRRAFELGQLRQQQQQQFQRQRQLSLVQCQLLSPFGSNSTNSLERVEAGAVSDSTTASGGAGIRIAGLGPGTRAGAGTRAELVRNLSSSVESKTTGEATMATAAGATTAAATVRALQRRPPGASVVMHSWQLPHAPLAIPIVAPTPANRRNSIDYYYYSGSSVSVAPNKSANATKSIAIATAATSTGSVCSGSSSSVAISAGSASNSNNHHCYAANTIDAIASELGGTPTFGEGVRRETGLVFVGGGVGGDGSDNNKRNISGARQPIALNGELPALKLEARLQSQSKNRRPIVSCVTNGNSRQRKKESALDVQEEEEEASTAAEAARPVLWPGAQGTTGAGLTRASVQTAETQPTSCHNYNTGYLPLMDDGSTLAYGSLNYRAIGPATSRAPLVAIGSQPQEQRNFEARHAARFGRATLMPAASLDSLRQLQRQHHQQRQWRHPQPFQNLDGLSQLVPASTWQQRPHSNVYRAGQDEQGQQAEEQEEEEELRRRRFMLTSQPIYLAPLPGPGSSQSMEAPNLSDRRPQLSLYRRHKPMSQCSSPLPPRAPLSPASFEFNPQAAAEETTFNYMSRNGSRNKRPVELGVGIGVEVETEAEASAGCLVSDNDDEHADFGYSGRVLSSAEDNAQDDNNNNNNNISDNEDELLGRRHWDWPYWPGHYSRLLDADFRSPPPLPTSVGSSLAVAARCASSDCNLANYWAPGGYSAGKNNDEADDSFCRQNHWPSQSLQNADSIDSSSSEAIPVIGQAHLVHADLGSGRQRQYSRTGSYTSTRLLGDSAAGRGTSQQYYRTTSPRYYHQRQQQDQHLELRLYQQPQQYMQMQMRRPQSSSGAARCADAESANSDQIGLSSENSLSTVPLLPARPEPYLLSDGTFSGARSCHNDASVATLIDATQQASDAHHKLNFCETGQCSRQTPPIGSECGSAVGLPGGHTTVSSQICWCRECSSHAEPIVQPVTSQVVLQQQQRLTANGSQLQLELNGASADWTGQSWHDQQKQQLQQQAAAAEAAPAPGNRVAGTMRNGADRQELRCCSSMSVLCEPPHSALSLGWDCQRPQRQFNAHSQHTGRAGAGSGPRRQQLALSRPMNVQLQQQQQLWRPQQQADQSQWSARSAWQPFEGANAETSTSLSHHDDMVAPKNQFAPTASSLPTSPIAHDKLGPFVGVGAAGQLQRPRQQQQQRLQFAARETRRSPYRCRHSRRTQQRRASAGPHHNQQQQQQQFESVPSRSIQLKDYPSAGSRLRRAGQKRAGGGGNPRNSATAADDDDGGRNASAAGDGDDDYYEEEEFEDEEYDESDSLSVVPVQAKGRLSASVAEQMKEQASNFVQQYGFGGSGRSSAHSGRRSSAGRRQKPSLQVRRTLRVKIRKSKPILGIAIEGGFNVSGQLLPRIVCVHEDGAAYQCGKLRASDLILEVNGTSTVNMTHDEIAKTIATAYYQDPSSHIEFLIGESVVASTA